MATRTRQKAEIRKTNKDTRPKAIVKSIRITPTKCRRVLNGVRGKDVGEALAILANINNFSSEAIAKCINSAVANAVHNNKTKPDNLYVAECFADVGPTLKRGGPAGRGHVSPILKRTSRITVILDKRA